MRIRKTHDVPVVHELVKTPNGEESPAALAGVPPTAVLVGVAGERTLRLGYEEAIGRSASRCKVLRGCFYQRVPARCVLLIVVYGTRTRRLTEAPFICALNGVLVVISSPLVACVHVIVSKCQFFSMRAAFTSAKQSCVSFVVTVE